MPPEPAAARSTPGREVSAVAVDLVVPVAAYYLLRGGGIAPGPALLLARTPWGAGLLVDAAVRLAMALALPVDVVPALGSVLSVVTFVGLQVIQQVYFVRVDLWGSLADSRPVGPID
ncbi:hypothetical protein [Frankia sp. EAN1pec]|uniref:hypothetical protein n=1 Tax=Parafrankia sp. (strain EAN1pec) TaxID=298653 RepID=UPI0003076B85